VIGHPDGSEDIVQQALAIAIEKDESFQSEGQFVNWLAGVVRNCALNQRRKKSRRRTRSADPELMSIIEGAAKPLTSSQLSDAPADMLAESQMVFDDQVLSALQQLSAEARACLLLRTVEQLSYRDISKLMHIPEGTAMSHVHRSRLKLRQLLADRETDAGPYSKGPDNA
jgi:RNA polymerase sigma-70 factor (ECF subfamily)